MSFTISDLVRWEGTLDRGPYAVAGALLFVVKHNIDRFLASLVFDRPWGLFNYLWPSSADLTSLSSEDMAFYSMLLAIALPFITAGTLLTAKRLRSARLPVWLVVLFFLPFLNLLLFAILCVVPSATAAEDSHTPPMPARARLGALLDRIVPDHPVGSAAMAVLLLVPVFAAAVALGVLVFKDYGWGVFVGIPFCLGLCSVLLYGYHEPRGFGTCLLVACLSCWFLGLAIAALAIEGAICLAMAAPIGMVLSLIGGAIGWAIQRRPWASRDARAILVALAAVLPALMGAEHASPVTPPLIAVRTAVEIDATPERVWRNVVSFSELPPPEHWLFRAGIAYPVRAEIRGVGVGAVRHCVFSTGPFVEPIEVWDEPRLLKFSVTAQPPAMQELSYVATAPPHLDGYLASKGGQFLLTELPGGRTRLEGTTWYENRMWPSLYWQGWSDAAIHRIHLRVLEHVKRLSEDGVS
jgi:hypothetical protein